MQAKMQLIKEILKTLLSDSIRQLYIERRQISHPQDKEDITNEIQRREDLINQLESIDLS